jgi:hypothetical protein
MLSSTIFFPEKFNILPKIFKIYDADAKKKTIKIGLAANKIHQIF